MKKKDGRIKGCLLFDWGNTLMRDFPEFQGPMKDWPRLEVLPYAAETLATLSTDWTLALATSADVSSEADIRTALDKVHLGQWLERIYSFTTTGLRKTSPDFYNFILKDLGLSPHQVIMIGDHFEADVHVPNLCGMRALWLNESTPEVREGTLYRTVHSLAEIPALLKKWGENAIPGRLNISH
jgi:putative hydrolase of the HAD superfamily